MLVYHQDELLPLGYMALDFHFDRDYCKSTFGFVFTLGGETVSWRNVKQSYIVDFTLEAKYVVAFETTKEAIWIWKFQLGLGYTACGTVL